jgi:hypothetical protein
MPPEDYIRWHIRWQKPFPPSGSHNTLIPRQFACAIAPDPIAFLLPTGHQQATHAAYRTSLGKTYWVGRSGERHDELARTVPTVPYRSPVPERFPQPALTTTLRRAERTVL